MTCESLAIFEPPLTFPTDLTLTISPFGAEQNKQKDTTRCAQ